MAHTARATPRIDANLAKPRRLSGAPRSGTRRPLAALLVAVALGGGAPLACDRSPEPPAREPAAEPKAPAPPPTPPESAASAPPEAPDGKALFLATCMACHGADAKGIPGLGKDMTTSEFIASKSDAELVEFIKRGRPIDDPLNTTGVPMPPKGANPALSDADLLAIVRFIRSLRG